MLRPLTGTARWQLTSLVAIDNNDAPLSLGAPSLAYTLLTSDDRQAMLQAVNSSIEDILKQIPADIRLRRPLDVPPALSEQELSALIGHLAAKNLNTDNAMCFLGGGAYDHFIPAAVDEIVSRGEYYTAYTPYQAEASQGSLQAFFEYQSMICQLTGLDVSNASLYEGATAMSEAAFMAIRVTRRSKKIVVLGTVHPEYRQVLETYFGTLSTEIVVIPMENGGVNMAQVEAAVDDQTACLLFQHPNVFGCLEQPEQLTEIAHRKGGVVGGGFRSHEPGVVEASRSIRGRHRRGRGAKFGHPHAIWRAVVRHHGLHRAVHAEDAGPVDRQHRGPPRPTLFCVELASPRTTHSPG